MDARDGDGSRYPREETSPVEVTKALLDRIEKINPSVNAYCLVTSEMALKQAEEAEVAVARATNCWPLHGVPVSIKDLFDVPGLPTTKGSLIYKDNVATSWEYSAKALIKRGGVHLGKTNTPEFEIHRDDVQQALRDDGEPWDTTRIAGGSSGGAASAVAAGLGPIAHGSDGGGSIRIPASICGVFGLKPTFGRIPKKPGGWSTMTHRGPITRTVSDAALAMDVMAHYEPDDPFSVATYPRSFLREVERPVKRLRVAWSGDLGFAAVEPEVANICERAAKRFAEFGCESRRMHRFGNQSMTFLNINTPSDAVWIGDFTDEQCALPWTNLRGSSTRRARRSPLRIWCVPTTNGCVW